MNRISPLYIIIQFNRLNIKYLDIKQNENEKQID